MDLSFNGANATSANNPATIWCDNNYDRWAYDWLGLTYEQDDVKTASAPDSQYTTNGLPAIPTTRDLEDYFRLWTPGVAALMKVLPANYIVRLTLSGDGQIRIFQAIEPDGGTNYLFDEATASNQVINSTSLYIGLLTSSSPIVLPIQTNFNEHFIFCGAQTGSAQVDLQVLDGNGNVVADSPTYLQIKDIKDMYERWTVGENPNAAPMNVATNAADNLPDPMQPPFQYPAPQDANTSYILFAHGWNMATWEKDRYAETTFKRLYWQGYHGRFGSFRWPTAGLTSYDPSEFQAWKSGTGLLNLLTKLNAEYPGNVNLIAHSMGNVVAGEALKQAGANQVVNTYIAMQAAIPSHCYDSAAITRSIPSADDNGTPNRYAYYWTDSSPCYFNGVAGAGTCVNLFNPQDFALRAWTLGQNTKPDVLRGYGFNGTNFIWGYPPTLLLFPADTYEIFSFCDEARCYALGAQPNVGGAFTGNQVELDLPPYNFTDDHVYHSGEFRSDYAQRWQFWYQILHQMGLK